MRWCCLIVVAVWLGYGSYAQAQSLPSACTSTRNASGYRAGYAGGGSLVRQAWAKIDDCDGVEDLEAAVKQSLRSAVPRTSPTTYLECRFAGLAQGAADEIDGLFSSCADSCYLEGAFVGEVMAVAYCELSILLRGLGVSAFFVRGPVRVCGLAFEFGCDEDFDSTAISYGNVIGKCLPYTRTPYTKVFDQTRNNLCAYNPLPPTLQKQ